MATWTTEDLEAIEAAIASGALKVEYNDRIVTYRSINELIKARYLIRVSLGLINRSGRILCKAKKGLC